MSTSSRPLSVTLLLAFGTALILTTLFTHDWARETDYHWGLRSVEFCGRGVSCYSSSTIASAESSA